MDELNNVTESKGPKKLILNRNLSTSEESTHVSSNGSSESAKVDTDDKCLDDKKVVKLSELTAKEVRDLL